MAHAEEPREILIESLTGQSEIVFDYKNNLGWGTNGVIVRYTNAVLTAHQALVNLNSGEAQAQGEVVLQRDSEVWRGERLLYNFKTRALEAENFRTGKAPFFVQGDSVTASLTNRSYVINRAFITTDDLADPAYRIRAHSIKITEGKSIEARNATLLIGEVPVMFFPYYNGSLERHPNNWVLTPGYRSLYGPYLLGTYNWFLSTNLYGALNIDYRQKRGFGVGPKFGWDLGRWGAGDTRFYYTR
jgi:lipopolysaccharide assembly outer membrane protein LptD (OstA)